MANETALQLARQARQELATLNEKINTLDRQYEKINPLDLLQRIRALEVQVAELKRQKEEGEKRHWQYVHSALVLCASFVVQLFISFIRKN